MKRIITMSLALLGASLSAATVEWNVFAVRQDQDLGACSIYYYGGDKTPEIGFRVQGDSLVADSAMINCGCSVALWALGIFDDVITEEYVRNCQMVGDVYFSDLGEITLSDMLFVEGEEYYLVLAGKGCDVYYTSWVNFAVEDGAISIIGSAVSDGSLYVGGGAVTIPEPSGGLLLILGVAMLALKRKTRARNNGTTRP